MIKQLPPTEFQPHRCKVTEVFAFNLNTYLPSKLIAKISGARVQSNYKRFSELMDKEFILPDYKTKTNIYEEDELQPITLMNENKQISLM